MNDIPLLPTLPGTVLSNCINQQQQKESSALSSPLVIEEQMANYINQQPQGVNPNAGRGGPTMRIQPLSYATEIPLPSSSHPLYEGMLNSLGQILGCCGSVPCFGCCPNPYKTVNQGNVGLISKFGRFYRAVDPGLYFINLFSESMLSVDIKIQVEDIPRQIVMTKDNVLINVDSVLYWHIVDVFQATFAVSNVRKALIERTQTTLRQILGMRTLQDTIENREVIAHEIQNIISQPAAEWGVKVESILIKDLQFSQDLQESLSMAAKQKRAGEAKVILAQAEVESAKLMREASDILNTPAAMQIRYLETLQGMSKAAGTKVIFMPQSPQPMGMITANVLENMSS
jgi:regulator of protease activity HflC (stomatin/prohibitin superfamily)